MPFRESQAAKIVAAQTILADVLRNDHPSQETAERLEDASNLLLDLSEEIGRALLANRATSK